MLRGQGACTFLEAFEIQNVQSYGLANRAGSGEVFEIQRHESAGAIEGPITTDAAGSCVAAPHRYVFRTQRQSRQSTFDLQREILNG